MFWAYEAAKDASQALDCYFEHYNQGRPFFLAGHSQGAAVVEALLEGYFKQHPEYYSRMIAALHELNVVLMATASIADAASDRMCFARMISMRISLLLL